MLFTFTFTFLFIEIVMWLVPWSTKTFFRGTCSSTFLPSLLLLYCLLVSISVARQQTNKLRNIHSQAFVTNAASSDATQTFTFTFTFRWWSGRSYGWPKLFTEELFPHFFTSTFTPTFFSLSLSGGEMVGPMVDPNLSQRNFFLTFSPPLLLLLSFLLSLSLSDYKVVGPMVDPNFSRRSLFLTFWPLLLLSLSYSLSLLLSLSDGEVVGPMVDSSLSRRNFFLTFSLPLLLSLSDGEVVGPMVDPNLSRRNFFLYLFTGINRPRHPRRPRNMVR